MCWPAPRCSSSDRNRKRRELPFGGPRLFCYSFSCLYFSTFWEKCPSKNWMKGPKAMMITGPRRGFQEARGGDPCAEEPRQAGLRTGSGTPQARSGAHLYPLKQKEKEPLHKLCGGSFCVHDEIKNKISAEHAQSECGGHLNRKDVTSYLPSRSGCGCDGPASPPQRCSRRRWAQ